MVIILLEDERLFGFLDDDQRAEVVRCHRVGEVEDGDVSADLAAVGLVRAEQGRNEADPISLEQAGDFVGFHISRNTWIGYRCSRLRQFQKCW